MSRPPVGGVRLGVDVGSVRVGLAASDADGRLALPVRTIARRADGRDLDELASEVRTRAAVEVVVGLPRGLSGREGPAAGAARAYARQLAGAVAPVPVRLADERLTTVAAHRALAGVPGRARRAVVDQVAAAEILQAALDAARAGAPPGELVQAAG